jgi:hypothetical protein
MLSKAFKNLIRSINPHYVSFTGEMDVSEAATRKIKNDIRMKLPLAPSDS